MLDKETAQKLAQNLKIDLFTIYREYLQLLFLKYFYQQKKSEKVYFKGGTALHFLFNSFRFSEDLDFTSSLNSKELNLLIQKALKDLNKEAPNTIFRKEKNLRATFSGRLFQKIKEFKIPITCRLEFSLREKPLNIASSFLETVFPIGPYPQISHLKIEEIMAEKIRAVLTRVRGRDLFDLWFLMSKRVPIDWKLVNLKMAYYKEKADLKKIIKAVEKISPEEIKSDLTKFLPITHRNLVNKIKEIVIERLENP